MLFDSIGMSWFLFDLYIIYQPFLNAKWQSYMEEKKWQLISGLVGYKVSRKLNKSECRKQIHNNQRHTLYETLQLWLSQWDTLSLCHNSKRSYLSKYICISPRWLGMVSISVLSVIALLHMDHYAYVTHSNKTRNKCYFS